MNTLRNIKNIIKDLDKYENNSKYKNISNRLDKVLDYYLYCLDNQYNKILNSNNITKIVKELSK